MSIKTKLKGGYIPKRVWNEEKWKTPKTKEEILLGAAQEHELVQNNKWPDNLPQEYRPNFIKETIDNKGHRRIIIREEEGMNELQKNLLTYFIGEEKDEINWNILRNTEEDIDHKEWEEYRKKTKKKEPGPTQMKLELINSLETEIKKVIMAFLSACLRTGIMPSSFRHVSIAHIPKNAGGTRPLGLMHELLKTIDFCITSRLEKASRMYERTAGNGMHNVAYRKGQSAADIIAVDMLRLEELTRTGGSGIIRIAYDLLSWFDGIQRDALDAILVARKIPTHIIEWWSDLSNKLRYKVITTVGQTREIRNNIGVVQGALSSPFRSRMALLAFQKCRTEEICKWKQTTERDNEAILSFLCFADDGVVYVHVDDLPKMFAIWEKVGAMMGIGFRVDKIEATSIDKDVIGQTFNIRYWNWKKGKMEGHDIKVTDGEKHIHNMLGIRRSCKKLCQKQQDHIINKTLNALKIMERMSLGIPDIGFYVQAKILSHMAYTAHTFIMNPNSLKIMDKNLIKSIRRSLKLPCTTSFEAFFTKRKHGGLGLYSCTLERIADLLREYIVYLNDETTAAGHAYKKELEEIRSLDIERYDKQVITFNLAFLAQFGFIFISTDNLIIANMLMTLIDKMETIDISKYRYCMHEKWNYAFIPKGELQSHLKTCLKTMHLMNQNPREAENWEEFEAWDLSITKSENYICGKLPEN